MDCSSGDATIWKYIRSPFKLEEQCTINIGCRPICLTLIDTLTCDREALILKSETSVLPNKTNDESMNKVIKTISNGSKVTIENDVDDVVNNKNEKLNNVFNSKSKKNKRKLNELKEKVDSKTDKDDIPVNKYKRSNKLTKSQSSITEGRSKI